MKLFRDSFFENLLFLAHSFLLVLSQDEFDFCSLTCNGKKHTLCEYPENGPEECQSFKRGVEKAMKIFLLHVHNNFRQKVAIGKGQEGLPLASDIVQLEWSDEAERIAQRWADQCTQGEREDECRSLSDGEAGAQNIAVSGNEKGFDVYTLQKFTVMNWFKSGENFKVTSLEKYKSDPASDPFVKSIWARTDQIGCGYSHGKINGSEVYRLVCNYYPGPIAGEPVYLEGKPCTKCPNARCNKPYYPALCAPPTDKVYNRNDTGGVAPRLSDSYYTVSIVSWFLALFIR